MNLDTLALIALVLAAAPAGLFLVNLLAYRPLPRGIDGLRFAIDDRAAPNSRVNRPSHIVNPVSVLIPARNEEQNIRSTLEALLTSRGADFEVIVLDDHSTDRTAAIVAEIAARDGRVRLESAPPLPAGWCGKQHACFVLSKLARHPLLVFIDADVRLAADALARLAGFLCGGIEDLPLTTDDLPARQTVNRKSSIINPPIPALVSGVPRQEVGTLFERLLIPLIHFILLGFLPMHAMRRTRWPAMSAGCGQLFVARRDAYFAAGGHAAIRGTMHDGVKLPRAFRRAGFTTDLFDATDLATCRMYRSNADTWRGLGKNATEGLAAPGTILPMTMLLLGGQVLPFLLLFGAPLLSPSALLCSVAAAALAYLPRLLGVVLYRQPLGSAWLHPFGVLMLLMIQWHALLRHFAGRPAEWKGRSYDAVPVAPARKIA